ncbi:cytochrome c [Sedimentitalea todarodis]|uniref:Cytochrome c n=1 Tax=Sedimentitalea todarodis TaxID=1631240 RepID=A0ABU3VEK6_9RHOB|nr:cytochrome c [Sedimentitalea todarodis]MDU9004608.1 cytochrome c [Sedimentitalea todarodis]
MRALLLCLTLLLSSSPAVAQDGLGLAAPEPVVDSGLLKHILPRFSLKTSIRVTPDTSGPMTLAAAPPGVPVFHDDSVTYHLRIADDPRQQRFRDWLLSEVGKATIDSFQRDGVHPFSARFSVVETADAPVVSGNAKRGAELSLVHCGRCHVVGPENRMNGLGSTPSFAALRSLPDWIERFEQFFVRNPHGAFTQIIGVTPPFEPERPPPIVPVELTVDDIDAIISHVAQTRAADLGAPLALQ